MRLVTQQSKGRWEVAPQSWGSCTNQESFLTVILGGISPGSVLSGSPTHLANGNVWKLDPKESFGFQSLQLPYSRFTLGLARCCD